MTVYETRVAGGQHGLNVNLVFLAATPRERKHMEAAALVATNAEIAGLVARHLRLPAGRNFYVYPTARRSLGRYSYGAARLFEETRKLCVAAGLPDLFPQPVDQFRLVDLNPRTRDSPEDPTGFMYFLHPALTLFHELMHDTRGRHQRVVRKHRTFLSGKWQFDLSIKAPRQEGATGGEGWGPETLPCTELEALARSVIARQQHVAPALPWREASYLHEVVVRTLGRMRNLRCDRRAFRLKENDQLMGKLLREEHERCVAKRRAPRDPR